MTHDSSVSSAHKTVKWMGIEANNKGELFAGIGCLSLIMLGAVWIVGGFSSNSSSNSNSRPSFQHDVVSNGDWDSSVRTRSSTSYSRSTHPAYRELTKQEMNYLKRRPSMRGFTDDEQERIIRESQKFVRRVEELKKRRGY